LGGGGEPGGVDRARIAHGAPRGHVGPGMIGGRALYVRTVRLDQRCEGACELARSQARSRLPGESVEMLRCLTVRSLGTPERRADGLSAGLYRRQGKSRTSANQNASP